MALHLKLTNTGINCYCDQHTPLLHVDFINYKHKFTGCSFKNNDVHVKKDAFEYILNHHVIDTKHYRISAFEQTVGVYGYGDKFNIMDEDGIVHIDDFDTLIFLEQLAYQR